jgi:hypothetical protein
MAHAREAFVITVSTLGDAMSPASKSAVDASRRDAEQSSVDNSA